MLILCVTTVSAWPFQLYSDGTVVDLDPSNSGATELVVYYITNISYFNTTLIENKTYQTTETIKLYNYTYVGGNYTFYNVTEYVYDGVGNFTYNKTEIDAKFLAYYTGEGVGGYELENRLTYLNSSLTAQINAKTTPKTTWLWVAIFINVLFTAAVYKMATDNQYG